MLNGSYCFWGAQKMPADTPGSVSQMSCNYAGKEEQDGWETTDPFFPACLTSAAQGLLLTDCTSP